MWRWISLVALAMLMIGCVRNTQRVLLQEQVVAMPELAGKWVPADEADKQSFELVADGNQMRVSYRDSNGRLSRLVARLGKVQGLLIAEIGPDKPAPETGQVYEAHVLPLYSFFVMTQTGPELRGRAINADWFIKYADAHPQEIRLLQHGDSDRGVFDMSTADLQSFILKHWGEEKAWDQEKLWKRAVGNAEMRSPKQE